MRGRKGTVPQPLCIWCGRDVVGIVESAYGGSWKHTTTNRELCPDGVTIAEPEGHPDGLDVARKLERERFARRYARAS